MMDVYMGLVSVVVMCVPVCLCIYATIAEARVRMIDCIPLNVDLWLMRILIQ